MAETLYPKKKIIVWGHNYHVRKQNTKMIQDWTYVNGPNIGYYLPERLKKQTYTIGIYAYSGASLDSSDNKTVMPVTSPPPAGSLEALLKAADLKCPLLIFSIQETRKALCGRADDPEGTI
ncbi:hypothetical protein BSBH6_03553 [Bacillus subtilis]|nr:hypothetical protein BSBH6_03553 [Bacillus subtilis]RPK22292.1 hypothetical protein BH5_03557 [Bacillus subtilis]